MSDETWPVYMELIDLIVAETTPQNLASHRPSQAARDRVDDLIRREKIAGLSPDETRELAQYLTLEHVLRLAKARAHEHLVSE